MFQPPYLNWWAQREVSHHLLSNDFQIEQSLMLGFLFIIVSLYCGTLSWSVLSKYIFLGIYQGLQQQQKSHTTYFSIFTICDSSY